ncbi:MAG: hypothetical protein LUQ07_07760 [Methanospirillum sp.]|nr:hypothetical protein [Methanospirillum sp.]
MFWYDLCSTDNRTVDTGSLQFQPLVEALRSHRDDGTLAALYECKEAAMTGFFVDRATYISVLNRVTIGMVVRDLEDSGDKNEMELIHLVRILEETDRTISRMNEKIEDYYLALSPSGLTDSKRNIWGIVQNFAVSRDHPLHAVSRDLMRLRESRTHLAVFIRQKAEETIPNMSALCGPLVASRLLSTAGSKKHLASMSSTSLQVLGAGPSLFSHLVSGTKPPKHGLIYEFKGIHNSGRKVRGRVSRVVACQLSIAARIDFFRVSRDDEFIRKAGERISRAGGEK